MLFCEPGKKIAFAKCFFASRGKKLLSRNAFLRAGEKNCFREMLFCEPGKKIAFAKCFFASRGKKLLSRIAFWRGGNRRIAFWRGGKRRIARKLLFWGGAENGELLKNCFLAGRKTANCSKIAFWRGGKRRIAFCGAENGELLFAGRKTANCSKIAFSKSIF